MPNKLIGFLVVVVLLLVIIWLVPKALPGAAQVAGQVANPVAKAVAVHCYVGYTGHNATISVTGIAAGAVCDKIVASDKNLFRMTQAPAEKVICERDYSGFHFTVRDKGILNTIGNQLCKKMQDWR